MKRRWMHGWRDSRILPHMALALTFSLNLPAFCLPDHANPPGGGRGIRTLEIAGRSD
jgi:hypothetical protein